MRCAAGADRRRQSLSMAARLLFQSFPLSTDRGTPPYNGLVRQRMFCTSWGRHQSVPCADDKTWIDLALLDALPQRLHLAHDVILGRSSWRNLYSAPCISGLRRGVADSKSKDDAVDPPRREVANLPKESLHLSGAQSADWRTASALRTISG